MRARNKPRRVRARTTSFDSGPVTSVEAAATHVFDYLRRSVRRKVAVAVVSQRLLGDARSGHGRACRWARPLEELLSW
jgi:hypothetical protein